MKKFLKLFPVALAAFAVASCSDYDEQSFSKSANVDGSKIYATIGDAQPTRVAIAVNDEGNRGLVFAEGDELRVYNLTASTQFYGYTLESGANSDAATFAFSAAKSSAGIDAAPTLNQNFYAVTVNPFLTTEEGVDGQEIFSLSPGSSKPELSMSIPEQYEKKNLENASWDEGNKTGTGYTLPLPLWGQVGTDGDLAKVAFQYLTGFLKIDVTTMRAGTKYLEITADQPISGFFKALLDTENPASSVLAKDKALTNNNVMRISLPEANDYEGATDIFYVPLIAQTYKQFNISAYTADGTFIDELYDYNGSGFTVKAGKGMKLTGGMTVLSNLTNGKDISSKIYELCQRNPGKKVTLGLYNSLTTNQTIYIDKNATSNITIQMLDLTGTPAAITGNITIVEATPKAGYPDADGNVEWESDVTNSNSLSGTKKHEVNIIYNSSVANTGNLSMYLPASKASIASDESGTKAYEGKVTTLTATDGGFTIAKSAQLYKSASYPYTNYKDGPITVDGFTGYLYQYGNGAVTINNLDRTMEAIVLGTTSVPVTAALTINGLDEDGATTAAHKAGGNGSNKAIVRNITSYSTGTFTANLLDASLATSKWSFYATTDGGINITNNGNYITALPELLVDKKNDVNLTNAIVKKMTYNGKVKADVTANGKSAILTLAGDADDMLTINSEWDYTNGSDANIVLGGTKGALTTAALFATAPEIHTAFQFASLGLYGTNDIGSATAPAKMKSTTVINLKGDATHQDKWSAMTIGGNFYLNGDGNNQGANATIENLVQVPAADKTANNGGLFTCAKVATIANLDIQGVTIGNCKVIGTVISKAEGLTTLSDVNVSGITSISAVKDNARAGGLIGSAIGGMTLNTVSVSGGTITAEAGKNSVAGGLVAYLQNGATQYANTIDVDLEGVTADFAGGAFGEVRVGLEVQSLSGNNEVDVTKVLSSKAGGAAGGLIGTAQQITSGTPIKVVVQATDVTAGIEGLVFLGGMIGYVRECNVEFGDITTTGDKAKATSVSATFALNADQNTAANKTTYADYFGSANTYVGYVSNEDASVPTIKIGKWCKHGTPISTKAAKKALNFWENVIDDFDGVNHNYQYFYGGNPWVGVVKAGGIYFPDKDNDKANVVKTAGKDYNVRKNSQLYADDTWTADWE